MCSSDLVAPTACLAEGPVRTVRLRHPRTSSSATFLHDPSSGRLCELLAYTEEHRAWFVGDKLVSDGRLFLASPVHPVFLLLPYLAKAERLVPLDQLLEDDQFPLTEEVLGQATGLEAVAESKGAKDLNVWKYNSALVLAWLGARVERVALVLQEQGVDLTGGAVSHNYKGAGGVEPSLGEYKRHALGVVQEYLTPALGAELQEKLGLGQKEDKPVGLGQKRLSSAGHDGPKAKKAKPEGPAEDYTKKARSEEHTSELQSP